MYSSQQEMFEDALHQPISFWTSMAKAIHWFKFPEAVQWEDESGLIHWYKGGALNTCYLALDYHVENGRAEQTAIIYDSPVTGQKKRFSYLEAKQEVEKVAGALQHLGVEKGDRVVIYMPMIPETAFAMLACARLGAIHSVVFGGFAAKELATRIDDAQPKIILTASGGIEVSRIIPYKPIVDEALQLATHQPKQVVVYQRDFVKANMHPGIDLDWKDIVAAAAPADYVPVHAEDPLYILYTSGTTGKPKGVVRENGGHAVAMKFSMQYVYNAEPGEVYWAGSDFGWVVGHSYIVYGPLINGNTTIIYEGKPVKTPDAGAFWRVIQEYQVNTFFTAPTAFRAIRKEDPEAKLLQKYDISSLKSQFVAGERCDASTLQWLEEILKVPVIDHWWQTESGYPMISQLLYFGGYPVKPGSAGRAVPGFDITIINAEGQQMGPNEEGMLMIKYPLAPGALSNLWQDTQRFKQSYLGIVPGYYFSGDGAYMDEEGYVFVTGRVDDVINVAGHRLSTADMEEIIAAHPAVSECAVVGKKDDLKGQIPIGFTVLKEGVSIEALTLEKELIQMVRAKIGAVAAFKKSYVVNMLPKTRSGKILRNVIRAIADRQAYKMPSTILDPQALNHMEEILA